MKTVMKKIFSLMLVAVLLVGVMPFQAFASERTHSVDLTLEAGETYNVDDLFNDNYTGNYKTYWVHQLNTKDHPIGGTFVAEDATYILYVVEDVADSETTPSEPAPTEPAPTEPCGTCGKAPHEGNCCDTCKEAGHTADDHCAKCGNLDHDADAHCPTCNVVGHTANNCPNARVTITFVDLIGGKAYADVTGAPGETVTLPTIAWISGYEPTGWNINGTIYGTTYTIPSSAAGSTIRANAGYVKRSEDDAHPLKVYANLYTGSVRKSSVLIHSNNTMMNNDAILKYLLHADTQAQLWDTINNNYPGYSWSGHIYNAFNTQVATDNITTIDGAKTVYINLYSEANDVLIYVHTSKSESYDRLIQLDGFKTGETVTANTVKSELKKFYTVSSMKMYDATGWSDYMKGYENTDSTYVTVTKGVTKIHVRLSGYSSNADSTNPKTGDNIQIAMIALAVSASALAAAFYFNKKRAF